MKSTLNPKEYNEWMFNQAAWNGYNDAQRGTFKPAGILNSMHAIHYNKHYDAGYREGHYCRSENEVYEILKLNKTTRAGINKMRGK